MLTTIEVMPDSARLWVYQCSRKLNEQEQDFVRQSTQRFIDEWAAHGNGLKGSFTLENGHFLIIMVDERHAEASGCSIDSSVGLVRGLEQQLNVSFLDRSKIAIKNGDDIEIIPMNTVKSAIAEGKITSDTEVFNNAVASYGDWKNSWIQKAPDSWMGRFFR
jgi:hypothetical protein